MNDDEYPIELRDYWRIFVLRKYHFVCAFVAVITGAVALAFLLPTTYRSEAMFIIERQSIPSNLVATTVTSFIQEQIQQIRQRIVSRDTLLEIAEDFYLYPEELGRDPGAVVERLRDNIEVEMLDVEATDPDRGGVRLATIAFTVAFSAETPETAQAVTEELARRFLDQYKTAREVQTSEVSGFLEEETERLRIEISELEGELAGFKQEELRQLPELMGMNLNLHERTEQDIDQTEERIRAYEERIDAVRAELSLTEPYDVVRDEDGRLILTASQRLSVLTSEYLVATAKYSAKHPDVIRLAREIRILTEQTGSSARADELMNELVLLQDRLRQARQQYSDEHPEVANLEMAVAALQRGLQSAVISDTGAEVLEMPPDSPRYVALKSQLDSALVGLNAEEQKLATLTAKLEEYERRLFQTPVVERDFKSLSRDYENALAKYRELKDKQLQARLAQELEAGESAQQFQLASPAYLPSSPESPNRLGIFLLGGLLAFAAGIGSVALAEYQDTTIRSARMLASTLGSPPLAIIPQLRSYHGPVS